jgi:aryl-alcohol dehydrogenase-like predicted oxidoreductase
METLVGFIEEGLIGGIGLSEVAPATLRRASTVHPVAAVQSEYSLWTRQPELGMIRPAPNSGRPSSPSRRSGGASSRTAFPTGRVPAG